MSSMQTTSPCQPSDGEINTYLLITARILAAVGLSYILRDLYQLIKWPLFSHPWRLEVPDGKRSLPRSYDTFSCEAFKLTVLSYA